MQHRQSQLIHHKHVTLHTPVHQLHNPTNPNAIHKSPRNSRTRPPGYIELDEACGRSRSPIAPGSHCYPGSHWDGSPQAIGTEQTRNARQERQRTNHAHETTRSTPHPQTCPIFLPSPPIPKSNQSKIPSQSSLVEGYKELEKRIVQCSKSSTIP